MIATEKRTQVDTEKEIRDYNEYLTTVDREEVQNSAPIKGVQNFKTDYKDSRLKQLYRRYDEHKTKTKTKRQQRVAPAPSDFEKVLEDNKTYEEPNREVLLFGAPRTKTSVQSVISTRTKFALISSISVMVLLGVLAIYNIFAVNSAANSVDSLSSEIKSESIRIEQIENRIDDLTDTQTVLELAGEAGFALPEEADVVTIDLYEPMEVNTYPESGGTNWFDSVCNFLSKIFGG